MEDPLSRQTESSAPSLCADIAIDVSGATHGRSVYTYLVPPHLAERLRPGHLVWAPLRRGVEPGLVIRLHREPPNIPLKPVRSIVKPELILTELEMEVAHWLARETVSSLYAAASPFFPPGVRHASLDHYELADPDDPHLDELTPAQRKVVELLRERGQLSIRQIARELGKTPSTTLRTLEESGIIDRTMEVRDLQPAAKTEKFVRLLQIDMAAVSRSDHQRAILEVLAQRKRLLDKKQELAPLRELLRVSGAGRSALSALENKGLIEIVELPAGSGDSITPPVPAPVLTIEQSKAWSVIESAMNSGSTKPILLFGVTGSGKTELYLRMAGRALRDGKGAIMLLPEIALATQIVQRFEERFPGKVAVVHSAQADAERYAAWLAIKRGESPIVVGPRSAVFAPVRGLGCIVIDEEQDAAYKQDSDPRYHARKLAELLAERHGATLVLGSATPSMETAYRARERQIAQVQLLERVSFATGGVDTVQDRQAARLPEVRVIDMRAEARSTGATLIARPLEDAVTRSVGNREQAIVLLNRRGMSTIVICRDCGQSVECNLCDIPMVYHRDRDRMICHRCNTRRIPPRSCDVCGGPLDYFGAGTQRIEQEVRRFLPSARVLRVDRDSIRKLGGYEKILRRVERGEVDVVVGTQLVAKGLDFPRVTTVGVIQADSLLHLPDYRSAERTYQLISQVAGRAGRRASRGDVLVQTYTPDHYAVVAAAQHDFDFFYDHEIAFREQFRYPPFTRLGRFLFRAASEEQCREEAQAMAIELASHARDLGVAADLIGPAPAFVARIRGVYQWQVVLRADPPGFHRLLDGLPARAGWLVDIDPASML